MCCSIVRRAARRWAGPQGRQAVVRFGSARCLVPSRLIGAAVLITVPGKTIRVLEPFTSQIAAAVVVHEPGAS